MAAEPAMEPSVVFTNHFEAQKMGDHVREVRFVEPILLHKVQVLGRGEKPVGDANFEGRTFPNVRTMSLNVFAADKIAGGSTLPKLSGSGQPGEFVPAGRLVTDYVVIRGEYLKLSVAIYGRVPTAGEVPVNPDDDFTGVSLHLRPAAPHDSALLDLGDLQHQDDVALVTAIYEDDHAAEAGKVSDAEAPTSLAPALGLTSHVEADGRVAEHIAWVASLLRSPDLLEAELAIARLEALANDLGTVAKQASETTSALASRGPALVTNLVDLVLKCRERHELRTLRAALRAMAASLCSSATAAELLKQGGHTQLLNILRDAENVQSSIKLAALEVWLGLCSHAIGMEAFLGWNVSGNAGAATTLTDPNSSLGAAAPLPFGTAYEVTMSILLDGGQGSPRLSETALILLERAALYTALVRLDAYGARLGSADEAQAEDLTATIVEALADLAKTLEEQSTKSHMGARDESLTSLLDQSCPSSFPADPLIDRLVMGVGGEESFGNLPRLHGFLESFLTGRRVVRIMCTIMHNMPKIPEPLRPAVFAGIRNIVCILLSCVGGVQFLTLDMPGLRALVSHLETGTSKSVSSSSLQRNLPAVPRFHGPWARSITSAPQLANLITLHVRATRLVFLLLLETRKKGRDGLLREGDGLTWLRGLHQVLASGSAGSDSVVCAFRYEVLAEWLLRQLEGRIAEAATGMSQSGAAQPLASLPQPMVRHLVAILHTVTLKDTAACFAERYGSRILAVAQKTLEVLESGQDGSMRTLEFALASDGPEGSLGSAVRGGRRSADVACLAHLRELVAQLAPWQSDDMAVTVPAGAAIPVTRLLASIALPKGPNAFKRSANEERGSRLSLLLGGYCGHSAGVEVAEIDFAAGEANDAGDVPDEKFPVGDAAELPLLAMRTLCRRAAAGAKEALSIVNAAGEKQAPGADAPAKRDVIALLAPILVRCAASLNLNIEAQTVQEEKETIDAICATQQVHAQLLEATLETCFHLLQGFAASGVTQFRHTELLQCIFILGDKLMSNLLMVSPGSASAADPEFRLLLRHSLAWLCRIFRAWVQKFPAAAGGQVLQPLLRHCRVLPLHFPSGLLLIATCGNLSALLPTMSHQFQISFGSAAADPSNPEQGMSSMPLLFPSGRRSTALAHIAMKITANKDPAAAKEKPRNWGQVWSVDADAQDWEGPEVGGGGAAAAAGSQDPLVRALSRKSRAAVVAAAFGLVEQVSARRERLSINDLAELCSIALQTSLTTDALLHCIAVRVMYKLASLGIPLVGLAVRLGEACLRDASGGRGAIDSEQLVADISSAFDAVGTSAGGGQNSSSMNASDPGDGRALSRILTLLAQIGKMGPAGRRILSESGAETFCLSVLAQYSDALPSAAASQAIGILSQMFSTIGSGKPQADGDAEPPVPSVPRCRMVAKALSVLLNKQPDHDGHAIGPGAMLAALELLNSLSSSRSMCLNLLFSAQQDPTNGAPGDGPVSVTVSCAFRLTHCVQRLGKELKLADERWEATPEGSEEETAAEEVLIAWLNVGSLLAELCRTVLLNCPTASVFLALMLPGGAMPEKVDEAALKGVLAVVNGVLAKIAGGCRNGSIQVKAAEVVGTLYALEHQLLNFESGPPPTQLPAQDLDIGRGVADAVSASDPSVVKSDAGKNGETTSEKPAAPKDDGDVLLELMSIFSDAAALEEAPEWHAAAALDVAEQPGEGAMLEFDVASNRRKRKAAKEKADLEKKAKRQKQVQQLALTSTSERPDARRRPPDMVVEQPKDKVAKKVPTPAAAAAPASAQAASAAADAAPKAAAKAATSAGNQAEAMTNFVKDHPEFMRVLTNPKKLSDPRVKSMFIKELQNYPGLKDFLASKGVNLS